MDVRDRLDSVGCLGRHLGHEFLSHYLALEKGGCGVDPNRAGTCAENHDRDITRTTGLIEPKHRNGPCEREVPVSSRALEDRVTATTIEGKTDLGEQLLRGERGDECALEEVTCRNESLPGRASHNERRPERESHRGKLGRRISVREAPAHGPAMSDGRMGHQP